MTTETSLILKVESDSVGKATKSLDKLGDAAKGAEKQSDKLGTSEKKREKSTKKLTTATGAAVVQTKKHDTAAKTLTTSNEALAESESKSTEALKKGTTESKKAADAKGNLSKALSSKKAVMASTAIKAGVLSLAVVALKGSLDAKAEADGIINDLEILTGNASEAQDVMSTLREVVGTSQFKLRGVGEASKLIIEAKGSSEGLKEELEAVGNTASKLKIPIEDLAGVYADTFQGGVADLSDLNDVASSGIPIMRLLSEQYGVSSNEIAVMAEEGKISFSELRGAIRATGEEGGFAFNAMAENTETISGGFAEMTGNLGLLGGEIGNVVVKMGSWVSETLELQEAMGHVSSAAKTAADTIAWVFADHSRGNNNGAERQAGVLGLVEQEFAIRNNIAEAQRRSFVALEEIETIQQQINSGAISQADGEEKIEQSHRLIDNIERGVELQEKAAGELAAEISTYQEKNELLSIAEQKLSQNKEEIERIKNGADVLHHTEELRLDTLQEQNGKLASQIAQYNQIATAAKGAAAATAEITSAATTASAKIAQAASSASNAVSSAKASSGGTGGNDTAFAATSDEQGVVTIGGSSQPSRSSGGSSGISRPSPTITPRASGRSEFDRLKEQLERSEGLIERSYLKRLDLIRDNTEAGSAIRAELTATLDAGFEEESRKNADRAATDLAESGDHFEEKLAQISDYYDRRREVVLSSTTITEQERIDTIARLNEEQVSIRRAAESRRNVEALSAHADFLGGLSDLSAAAGKRGAKIAQVLAVSQATINAYVGFSNALSDPTPMPTPVRFALAGASLAAGLANVVTISSQSAGNFMQGGILGGGSATGDAVTFQGNRGEAVINFEQQRRLLNIANGASSAGGAGGGGNITIINQGPFAIDAEQSTNSQGERQITIRAAVNQAKTEIAREADTGSGPVVSSFQRNGLLNRRGSA